MEEKAITVKRDDIDYRYLSMGFILGFTSLCFISMFQKIIAGYNPWTPKGYIVPVTYGGLAGIVIGYYFDKVKALNRKLTDRITFLESLFPICSYCKKIRDKEGAWNQLESYFTKHAGTLFSHGICDECLEKVSKEFKLKKT